VGPYGEGGVPHETNASESDVVDLDVHHHLHEGIVRVDHDPGQGRRQRRFGELEE
jgi:hypothetical protein